jgi:hypothetical protein
MVVTAPRLLGLPAFTPTQLIEFLGVLVIAVDDRAPPARLRWPRPLTCMPCTRLVIKTLRLTSALAS